MYLYSSKENLLLKPLSCISGHVFAFGESRPLAIANMVLGLKEIQIRGEIRTNVDYTIDLLHVNCHLLTIQSCPSLKTTVKKSSERKKYKLLTLVKILCRLQITEKIRSTLVGWTVELLCELEQKGLLGISPLLEALYL